MSYTILITPTAIDDIAVAIEYYNALSPDLGYRFSEMVNEYFGRITANGSHLSSQHQIGYLNNPC